MGVYDDEASTIGLKTNLKFKTRSTTAHMSIYCTCTLYKAKHWF